MTEAAKAGKARAAAAILAAAPAALVPAIEIPLVLWTRREFIVHHPDYADDPPTISRAISDPVIGSTFGDMILLITALIAAAAPLILAAYWLTFARAPLDRSGRAAAYVAVATLGMLQFAASAGMVLTTQFTFATNHDLHMLGSYIFFAFQAAAILLATAMCSTILRLRKTHGLPSSHFYLMPRMQRIRIRLGLAVVGLSAAYGVLFAIKDWPLPASRYAVQIIYTQCEVLTIASFVLFLGSYAVDIHAMVRRGPLRSGTHWPAGAALAAAADTSGQRSIQIV